jgi:hypothetical protein
MPVSLLCCCFFACHVAGLATSWSRTATSYANMSSKDCFSMTSTDQCTNL